MNGAFRFYVTNKMGTRFELTIDKTGTVIKERAEDSINDPVRTASFQAAGGQKHRGIPDSEKTTKPDQ